MNENSKICALIAVRMKSKRLPKKALVDICGYTAIERVVNNLKSSEMVDEIILATSTNEDDDPIEELAKKKGLHFFRGDEDNVIKRFIDAGNKFNANIIVRVTGDCPLISYELTDYLIKSHIKTGADYTGIEMGKVPVGTFSEVINLSALEKLSKQNLNFDYSEYMTFYFKNNPDIFSLNMISPPEAYISPDYRLTLDYPADLELFRIIFKELEVGNNAIPLSKTIAFLNQHPQIAKVNQDLPTKWMNDQQLIIKLNTITVINK